jgi:hypothetical protein
MAPVTPGRRNSTERTGAMHPRQRYNPPGPERARSRSGGAAAGDPTPADGILDRIVHNAHRVEMRGDSMRLEQVAG